MAKAVTYVRVSSKEQREEGFSIPAQQKLLEEYADRSGLRIVQRYEDVETAKKAGRRHFTDMVRFLEENEDVEHLLVEKTDRLYRNFRDLVKVDDLGKTIHFVKENVVLGPDSRSSEKLSHNIKVVLAKNYIDNLSEETKKGQLEKARQGLWPSYAPLGYTNNRDTGGIDIDWPRARIIRKMFEAYAEGQSSLRDLVQLAWSEGLRSRNGNRVQRSAVAVILQNPIYIGDFRWDGEYYEGKHEAVISRELFARVQSMAGDRHRPRPRSRVFAFRGFLKCGHCGCAITPQQVKRYTYYLCTKNRGKCPGKTIREEELSRQLGEPLKRLRMTPDRAEWVLEAIRQNRQDELQRRERDTQELQRELCSLEKRIDVLYEDRINGVITDVFWKRKHDETIARQGSIQVELERLEEAAGAELSTAEQVIKLSQEAYSLYLSQDVFEQRKLADILYQNPVLVHGEVQADLAEPFDSIADAVTKESRLRERSLPGSLTDRMWLLG